MCANDQELNEVSDRIRDFILSTIPARMRFTLIVHTAHEQKITGSGFRGIRLVDMLRQMADEAEKAIARGN